MKRVVTLLLFVSILFTLTGCGEKNSNITTDETTTQSTSENEELYDGIDNSNGLKMKMYGDYYFSKDGQIYQFFDGKVVLTYTTINDDDKIKSEPKDIYDFKIRFSLVFENRINAEKENFNLDFVQEKEINGFKVKEYSGSVLDNSDNIHNTKAYTFTCGIKDCMVIAAPIENTDEMIEKMEKDIDIFMNNLAIAK